MSSGNNRMRGKGKSRLLTAAAFVTAFAAAAIIATSMSFALFSRTTATQTNHFSAGTVTLSNDTSGACSVSNLLPGSAPAPCTLKATYAGTVPGFMGLDVLIETQGGSGGTKLYKPSDSTNDLQITITDNQASPVTYVVPTASTTCPGSAPAGSTCYGLNDELVHLTGLTNGTAVMFTTTVSVPTTSTTGYQGGAAQVILTAHAAQAGNNGTTSGCTVGHSCMTVGWS